VNREILKSLSITNTRIIEIFSFAQVSSRKIEQIYKRTHFTQAVKLSNIFVILKKRLSSHSSRQN